VGYSAFIYPMDPQRAYAAHFVAHAPVETRVEKVRARLGPDRGRHQPPAGLNVAGEQHGLLAVAPSAWIALAIPVSAHEQTAGDVIIDHPHTHATAAVPKNGAVYMILRNRGRQPERLLAVRTDEAESAQVHVTAITADGVAHMRPASAVDIPPGGEVRLVPGGYHVMLTGLRHGPLIEGTSFPMTLVFEHAGEVEVEVMVDSANAGHEGHGSDHSAGHEP
jgi:copper(I)-binding protein